MRNLARRHPVVAFFAVAFVLSWAIWVPLALDHLGAFRSRLPGGLVLAGRLLGTWGPALAATIVARLADGRGGVRALWGLLGRWRVRWTWYAAALLVFPALLLLAAFVYRLLPGAAHLPAVPFSVTNLVVTAIVLAFSATGEEIGWRGFALPRLQRSTTALGASLLLGAVWTVWHLPFWVVLGELETFGWTYWLLSLAWITAGSVYLTWLMNNTGTSLPVALLFHAGYNLLSVGFLPLSGVVPAYGVLIAMGWAFAIGVLAAFGPKTLRRTP
jgi:membrane protease YdiL (CAAX protease family)